MNTQTNTAAETASTEAQADNKVTETVRRIPDAAGAMFRFFVGSGSAVVTFLLVVINFIGGLTIAYMMGDPTNDMPAIVRDSIQVLLLRTDTEIFWLLKMTLYIAWIGGLIISYVVMFWPIAFITNKIYGLVSGIFTFLPPVEEFSKSVNTGFRSQLFFVILVFITLAIIPIESHNYITFPDTYLELSESMAYTEFLLDMNFATLAVFGVGVFLVIVLGFLMLIGMNFFPDASPPMFFLLVFARVIIGVGVIMVIMEFLRPLIESINQSSNVFVAVFLSFLFYAAVLLPFGILFALRKKDNKEDKSEKLKENKKLRRKNNETCKNFINNRIYDINIFSKRAESVRL